MIKNLLAVASVIFLVIGSLPAAAAPPKAGLIKQTAKEAALFSAVEAKIPTVINFPSAIGEVSFRHEMHLKDLSVKCVDCHHEQDAKMISTPHPNYLSQRSLSCITCHDEPRTRSKKAFVCSECHTSRPKNIADETLSAKVVIHEQCWKCHVLGTGKEASKNCEKCHSGKKAP